MKGIILAGGAGTRLYPMTITHSKQLQLVYDKPMIYYPLSTLMETGIQDILIISTPHDIGHFEELLSDGSRLGLQIGYAVQPEPKGLAQAYQIGREFIGGEQSALILGDNIFYGNPDLFRRAWAGNEGATIFGKAVKDPTRYGVIEIDAQGKVKSLQEKPAHPRSDLAVPGYYFLDGTAPERADALEPSARGELEIIDLVKTYWREERLSAVELGMLEWEWWDAGTPSSLLDTAKTIETKEQRDGFKFGCLEEVALRRGYIDARDLERQLSDGTIPAHSEYGAYIQRMLARRS